MNLIELQRALRPTPARRHGRRAGNPPAPSPSRTHGAHRSDLLLWSPTNSRAAVTGCWNAGASRPTSATPTRRSTTSTSTSIPKMNRSLVFDLATGALHRPARRRFVSRARPAPAKAILAQAIGQAAIQTGPSRALSRNACAAGRAGRSRGRRHAQRVHGIDRVGATADHRRLRDAQAAAHRRRGSARNRDAALRARQHAADFNRPVEDWGKLLGDTAAVSAMLDRLLHHGHVLKCGPRSWRTKAATASNLWK